MCKLFETVLENLVGPFDADLSGCLVGTYGEGPCGKENAR